VLTKLFEFRLYCCFRDDYCIFFFVKRISGITVPKSFLLRKNATGHTVVLHKFTMSEQTWLPEDVSQAPRFVRDGVVLPFDFVVPSILPVQALQTMFSKLEERLKLLRSIMIFPNEFAGAASSWWERFLQDERDRISGMCNICCRIQSELSSIVIHQKKGQAMEEKEVNKEKTSRRKVLLEQLGR